MSAKDSIISKADLRSVVILIFVSLFVGSWIYFIALAPIDESKSLDITLLIMIMANLLVGTLVGIFAWLGFKQGQVSSQTG